MFRILAKVQLEAKSPTANVRVLEYDAAYDNGPVSPKDPFQVLIREVVWDIFDEASDICTLFGYFDVPELEPASSDFSLLFDRNVSDVKTSLVQTVSDYCLYHLINGHIEPALKLCDNEGWFHHCRNTAKNLGLSFQLIFLQLVCRRDLDMIVLLLELVE